MEAVPQIVANCKILSKLGQGGMGTVFRSVHVTLGRRMALKILPTEFTRSPEYVSRFLREARAIANLNHPNIVLVHDAGEQNGIYYIAMELVDGASLAAVTRHCSRVPEPAALDLLLQSAKGLGYAHDRGLVHRDIKPENLLINREGILKVVDFGLVLEASSQSHLTRTGTFLGTPTFMSPEQCDGDVADARSDLYALGATFYCILTGRAPFSATTAMGIMYKHKFEPPPPLDQDTSAQTCAIILKLLAKKREERYQTAKELLADVANAIRAVPPKADWSLEEVLTKIAPPLPEPTAEELALPSRIRSSETVTMRGKAGTAAAGSEFPSAGPANAPNPSEAFQPTLTPASGTKSPSSAWDPTVIGSRTPPPPGATPAPSPLAGTLTPAPAVGTSRKGLWAGVAAVIVLSVGLGSYFVYQNYRQTQLQSYVKNIENLRQNGSLEDAKLQLHLAMVNFPNEPQLVNLGQTIDADLQARREKDRLNDLQNARKEVKLENLVTKAKAAFEKKQYDDAIRSYEEARKLEPDSEEVKAGLQEANLAKLGTLIAAAEKDAKWENALLLAKQSLEYGGAYEQVQRLEQRMKVEELRGEAVRLSNGNELLAAADKYDEAAHFSTRDTTVRDELFKLAVQQRTKHHLNLATEAEKQNKWTTAIAALNNALKLTPKDAAIEKRLENARTAFRNTTSFDSAMSLGRKAMDSKQWSEAAEMYRAAIGHNKDHAEARELLAEALNRDVLSQADAKVKDNLWRDARELLDQVKADIGKMKTDVKIEYDRLSTLIQTSQDEIAKKETSAQTASKDGVLSKAIKDYEDLVLLNPVNRASYEKALAPLRVEHAYQEFLAEGDRLSKDGQFAKSRAAYQQAAEKKKGDAASQATVNSKLALLVASEKLFKVEPLISTKNWTEAQTLLTAIQKEIPADNKEATAAVGERAKLVDDTLARIGTLEETGRTAIQNQQWDDGRKALNQLIETNPSRKDTYQKQLEELEAAFKAYNDKKAREERYARQMGDARQKLGQEDFDGAMASAKQALEAMPDDPAAGALIKDAQEKKEAKAKAKLLNDTHQNVQGLLGNGQLDQAAAAADTAAKQNPAVTELNTMSSALKEMQNAKRSVASAATPLDEGRNIVTASAIPQADRQKLQNALQGAKERMAQQEADAVKQFAARNYAGAQNTVATLSTGAVNQARSTVESVAAAADKLGDDAMASNIPHKRSVGELSVDGGNSEPDAKKKAIPYRNLAKKLRDLATGIR